MLRLKSINELPQEEDGFRILIDEFWPENLSSKEVKVDLWLKEITPPTELEEWSGSDNLYYEKLEAGSIDELQRKKTLIKFIRETEKEKGTVTFLYSTIKSINELPV
ncbi:DUF488 domain-containing protein [Methanobacterium petrolearium]|uniref:DUF488 domain-containing protein n=1 Tax=Methanobacterium petrolearium TaxID=710190 RepID=UPI001AE56BA2|nr:DUF488 family protein [Methanobacterium petrolearium]MBP1945084.1 uncharacterized protein YeaO (DUF488 family) [Methanobacterium petrolearium]BDZ71003.1 hypothetical protein GCM10025861_15200 [Methanobacterium petrolearium]